MSTVALVPFKRFTRAKSRLRSRYSATQVEAIGRAMLADVLEALAGARHVARVCVLTDDVAVAELARRAGAAVRLRAPDPGLNAAIDDADAELAAQGCKASLVVLGDLPLLEAKHIDAIVDAGAERPVVIATSSDGGTALLLRRPPQCIPARFGSDSARAHEQAARAAGLDPLCLLELAADAALDLDTPEDARRLLERGRACRTRELLESFGR